jgi:predicted transposase/invertase (TIGR01784 family)
MANTSNLLLLSAPQNAIITNIKQRLGGSMDNKLQLLPVKSDFVFRLIFGDQRNVDILAAFLRAVLDIPDEEYDRLTIVDPHLKKEADDDKYAILDVKLHTVSGGVVHIEIQRRVHSDLRARTIYSQSKLVSEQISSGGKWLDIKRAITIVITEEEFVSEGSDYHYQFRYRTNNGMEFSDLTEINTLDLSKLPDIDDSTDLWYWMKFIKTDDEEVLDMLEARSPQMKRAVGVLKELSADEATRMIYEKQQMAQWDYNSRVAEAEEAERKWQTAQAELAEQAAELAAKDTALADKDAALAGKDAALAEQAELIKELQAKLADSK